MTPKEKAEELMLKYYSLIQMGTVGFAKQCALIAVDEALRVAFFATDEIYQFYFDVRKEIKKL
jgi:hypothetical protein